MKAIIEAADHEAVLRAWRGSAAKLWLFHVTHNKLVIALHRTGEPDALYLVAIGCRSMSGPFQWTGAEISIRRHEQTGATGASHVVVDAHAAFEVVCSHVVLVRGDREVPDDPFEGFLGEGVSDA